MVTSQCPRYRENSIMQNTHSKWHHPITSPFPALLYSTPSFCKHNSNEYCLFHQDWIWGFVWNHLLAYSPDQGWGMTKWDVNMLKCWGPDCASAPASWHFKATKLPGAQTPVSALSVRLQLTWSVWKLPRGSSLWAPTQVSVSGLTLHWGLAACAWSFWGQGIFLWGVMIAA